MSYNTYPTYSPVANSDNNSAYPTSYATSYATPAVPSLSNATTYNQQHYAPAQSSTYASVNDTSSWINNELKTIHEEFDHVKSDILKKTDALYRYCDIKLGSKQPQFKKLERDIFDYVRNQRGQIVAEFGKDFRRVYDEHGRLLSYVRSVEQDNEKLWKTVHDMKKRIADLEEMQTEETDHVEKERMTTVVFDDIEKPYIFTSDTSVGMIKEMLKLANRNNKFENVGLDEIVIYHCQVKLDDNKTLEDYGLVGYVVLRYVITRRDNIDSSDQSSDMDVEIEHDSKDEDEHVEEPSRKRQRIDDNDEDVITCIDVVRKYYGITQYADWTRLRVEAQDKDSKDILFKTLVGREKWFLGEKIIKTSKGSAVTKENIPLLVDALYKYCPKLYFAVGGEYFLNKQ